MRISKAVKVHDLLTNDVHLQHADESNYYFVSIWGAECTSKRRDEFDKKKTHRTNAPRTVRTDCRTDQIDQRSETCISL